MRISDWSSDVCSSDLALDHPHAGRRVDDRRGCAGQNPEILRYPTPGRAFGRRWPDPVFGIRRRGVDYGPDLSGKRRICLFELVRPASPRPGGVRVRTDHKYTVLTSWSDHILLIRCPAGSIDAGRSKDRGRWRMAAIGCRRAKLLGSAVSVSVSVRSEEHTSELQSLMRISYAVFCLKKKIK